jgi:modification methylase
VPRQPPDRLPEPALPLSVWATAQHPARQQRAQRYLPACTAHPAKMLPAIAAYSQPGDLVLDPMCGIGTTLVEAVLLSRDAVGIELEPRWADLARRNLAHARAQTPGPARTGRAAVHTGDARHLTTLLDPEQHGRVALVLTSPPYGTSLHGQARVQPGRGVRKYDDTYSTDPTNLGRVRVNALLDALTEILTACRRVLRPGGLVVLTARPWRCDGVLVDFPGALDRIGEQAGLVPFERNVALLCGLRDTRLVPRPSFFQLDHVRKARRRGEPLRVIAHEDVMVLRAPTTPLE